MAVVGAAVSLLAPMWQEHSQHSEHMKLLQQMHAEAIRLNEEHFLEEQQLQNVLHKKELALERELHSWQLLHDNDIAKREAIRDVWSQKIQHIQTLMTIDTLMFSCAYAIIVQGDMAMESSAWLLRCNAICQGISASSLFISIWFCLNAQFRMSQYNIHHPATVYHPCGKQHHRFLDFFRCHCAHVQRYAFITFYLGTAATVGNAAFFAYSKLAYEYGSSAAGAVFVAIACCAIFAPLVARLVGHIVDMGWFSRTARRHSAHSDTEDDEKGEDSDNMGHGDENTNNVEGDGGKIRQNSFFYDKIFRTLVPNEENTEWEDDATSDGAFGDARSEASSFPKGGKEARKVTPPSSGSKLMASGSALPSPSSALSAPIDIPFPSVETPVDEEDTRSRLSTFTVDSAALRSFQTSRHPSALPTPANGETDAFRGRQGSFAHSTHSHPLVSIIPLITVTGASEGATSHLTDPYASATIGPGVRRVNSIGQRKRERMGSFRRQRSNSSFVDAGGSLVFGEGVTALSTDVAAPATNNSAVANKPSNTSFLQVGLVGLAPPGTPKRATNSSRSSTFAAPLDSYSLSHSQVQSKKKDREELEAGAEEPSSMLVADIMKEISGASFGSASDDGSSLGEALGDSKRIGATKLPNALQHDQRGDQNPVSNNSLVVPKRSRSGLSTPNANAKNEMLRLWQESLEETKRD